MNNNKLKKGFVIPLILAIVAILAVGGGVFVYQNKKAEITKVPLTIDSNIPVTSQISTTTKDWKTYVNSNTGYSISYPISYHVAYENDLLNYDSNLYEKGTSTGVKIQIQKDSYEPVFDVSKIDQQQQLIKKLNSDILAGLTESKETAITAVSMGDIKYSNKVIEGPGGTFDKYYAFAKDGKSYYRILVWGSENDSKNVSQILSTFKFITPTVGSDRDIHGCIGSAGYSWCAEKNKCIRPWEEKCEVVATSTNKLECKTNDDCTLEVSCPGTGGFAHQMCNQGKCIFAPGVKERCTAQPQCNCPFDYILEGDVCTPKCYYSEPKCLALTIMCSNVITSTQNTLTVLSPNGGEVIPYGSVQMAGDLVFKWTTSEGADYIPSSDNKYYSSSSSLPPFSASIIDSSGKTVRSDGRYTVYDNKNGLFSSSFVGENKIETNVKYKIKVCDLVGDQNVCDESDDYFIVQ